MSKLDHTHIDRLKGSENYHTWSYAMQSVLAFHGLDGCIDDPVTDTSPEHEKKARARIVLAIDESLYVHVQKETSAADMWKSLKTLFDDHGLSRKIGLLRKMISVRRDDCSSMAEYLANITTTANKLSGIGFKITDEWIGAIMLAGLGDVYKPLIMGIESSGIDITGNNIQMKLIDIDAGKDNETAFYIKSKKSSKGFKNAFKCYNCGGKGHIANNCKVPKRDKKGDAKLANAFTAMTTTSSGDQNHGGWYIDSGASCHMTPHKDILNNFTPNTQPSITVANNQKLKVIGSGSTSIRVNDNDIQIKEVLVVPELSANLLSVSCMVESGNSVIFEKEGCRVININRDVLLNIKASNGTYKLNVNSPQCNKATSDYDELMRWHRKLGHLSYSHMCKLQKFVGNISLNGDKNAIAKCIPCLQGKQPRESFKHSEVTIKTKSVLELVHSDVCGKMNNTSIGGSSYFVTFIDDFSRKVFVYFMKQRSELPAIFKSFKCMVETQTERKIKVFRSDNGTEYESNEMKAIYSKAGIIHQNTCTYTPEQNGVAERMNRTLVERAKCMLFDADLGQEFWGEAINTAAFVINRSVNRSLDYRVPEGVWTNGTVNYEDLHIFGTPVMVHTPKQRRSKWDAKSKQMLFVGYGGNQKGFRCFDSDKKVVVVSRDVVFLDPGFAKVSDTVEINLDETNSEPNIVSSKSVFTKNEIPPIHNENTSNESADEVYDQDVKDESDDNSIVDNTDETETYQPHTRVRKAPERYGFATSTAREPILPDPDPVSVQDALQRHDRSEWRKAMEEEMDAMETNDTWVLTQLPSGRNPLKSKWVFKIKYDSNGNVSRYKARLVAKGCSQKLGIDYAETFSPVVRYTSIRCLIALAAKWKMNIDQMDAVTAFLQGDLEEEIYVQQPEGFDDNSGRVCKLNKSMYGLKQSSRQWNIKLDGVLKSFGLTKSTVDPCVYFNQCSSLIIAIYVDDVLIFWRDKDVRDDLKNALSNAFRMKDIGVARNCVGLNITFTKEGIAIDQSTYTKAVLHRFGMDDCKPQSTPSDTNQKLTTEMATEDIGLDEVPYQEAVGSLLYLVQGSRPDIAFAVSDVSRFNSKYGNPHWTAVKRIMRYLKYTINHSILYRYSVSDDLNGFCDSDWASDIDKRRSCTAYVFLLAEGAISWGCKRQPTIALSTTEAEYMALSAGTQEAIWLRQFFQQFDSNIPSIAIQCDNQSAMALATEERFRARTKHIDVRHHYIREKILDQTINITYVPSHINIADSLTKAVPKAKHQLCARGMGLMSFDLKV